MFALLGQAIYDDLSQQELSQLKDNITNEFLLSLKDTHPIEGPIDAWVNGDIQIFAERVDNLPLMDSLEDSFSGLKEYMYYHILDGVGHWDDIGYAKWVAEGFLRHFGHGVQPPAQEVVPSIFDRHMIDLTGLIDDEGFDAPPPLIYEGEQQDAMG